MRFRILPSGNLLITADNRDREELAYDLRPNFDHTLTEPAEKIRYSLSRRSCNLSISVDRRVVP